MVERQKIITTQLEKEKKGYEIALTNLKKIIMQEM